MENTLKQHWFWKFTFGPNNLTTTISSDLNSQILRTEKLFFTLLFVFYLDLMIGFRYHTATSFLDPIWPVFWVSYLPNFPWKSLLICSGFLLSLSSFFVKNRFSLKIALFVSTFLLVALMNSNGKISHSLHTLFIPLFCFLFIKEGDQHKEVNYLIFAASVFFLLSSYSLAGFWKILFGVKQFIDGEISLFNVEAFSKLLLVEYRFKPMNAIAEWIVAHPAIGILLLWLGILIELFSIVAFFFKKLHIIWGIALLLLHVFIAIIMEVPFGFSYLTLLPLLILSPFYKPKF